jgi:hypothetical protein
LHSLGPSHRPKAPTSDIQNAAQIGSDKDKSTGYVSYLDLDGLEGPALDGLPGVGLYVALTVRLSPTSAEPR